MVKKIIGISLGMIYMFSVTNASYTEIECGSNSLFGQKGCQQCFDGGKIQEGQNIAFLDDIWVNKTSMNKIMYKEDQVMPIMEVLNGSVLKKNPNDDSFWQYTSELEALYDKEYDAYILPPGQSVSWLKSGANASYGVEKLPEKGKDAGMLIFDVMGHNIKENGEIEMSDTAHRECVLYKSDKGEVAKPTVEEVKIPTPEPEQMTKVKTGPEMYYLVFIFSLFIGMIYMRSRKKV